MHLMCSATHLPAQAVSQVDRPTDTGSVECTVYTAQTLVAAISMRHPCVLHDELQGRCETPPSCSSVHQEHVKDIPLGSQLQVLAASSSSSWL